jgi:hypothetical protein
MFVNNCSFGRASVLDNEKATEATLRQSPPPQSVMSDVRSGGFRRGVGSVVRLNSTWTFTVSLFTLKLTD